MTPAQEAILGYLLREEVKSDSLSEVLKAVGTHAYHLRRDRGKEAARAADVATRDEARRLIGPDPRS